MKAAGQHAKHTNTIGATKPDQVAAVNTTYLAIASACDAHRPLVLSTVGDPTADRTLNTWLQLSCTAATADWQALPLELLHKG